jgi:IMP dehydrogenase
MIPSGGLVKEAFSPYEGFTYADFTTLNSIYSEIERKDISLKTDLGKGMTLEWPIIASPMDTVTNAAMCTAIALQGGIGVIHYNYVTPKGTPASRRRLLSS